MAGITHQSYARQATDDGLIPVNNLDGIKLTDYLYGKTNKIPDNVKQILHKQLNPHLFSYVFSGLNFIIGYFYLNSQILRFVEFQAVLKLQATLSVNFIFYIEPPPQSSTLKNPERQ